MQGNARQWHLRRYAAALSRHRAELMEVTMVGRSQQREVTNETSLIEDGHWLEEMREIEAALYA